MRASKRLLAVLMTCAAVASAGNVAAVPPTSGGGQEGCASVVATALPEGGVRLDWQTVPGATSYFVHRSDAQGSEELLATVDNAEPGVVTSVAGKLPFKISSTSSAALDGKVYFAGGWSPSKGPLRGIHAFDPASGEVSVVGLLPTARHWPNVAAFDGHLYIAGGVLDEHTDEILRFDPATGEVEVAARLPTGRSYLTSAVVDDAIYYFGGDNQVGVVLDEVLRFDPTAGTVEVLPDRLPYPREWMATAYVGGTVWLLGGGILSPFGADDAIVRFDPETGTSEEIALTLPEARARVAGVTDGRYVYALGGRTYAEPHASVYRFDPLFGEVLALQPGLPEPRSNAPAVLVGDSAYYIGGTSPDEQTFLDTILRVRFEGASATTYTDTTTETGRVYGYTVVADVGHVPEGGCPEASVTAIPDFPGLAVLVATVAGVLAYARRR